MIYRLWIGQEIPWFEDPSAHSLQRKQEFDRDSEICIYQCTFRNRIKQKRWFRGDWICDNIFHEELFAMARYQG